jgi:hypothetical protein
MQSSGPPLPRPSLLGAELARGGFPEDHCSQPRVPDSGQVFFAGPCSTTLSLPPAGLGPRSSRSLAALLAGMAKGGDEGEDLRRHHTFIERRRDAELGLPSVEGRGTVMPWDVPTGVPPCPCPPSGSACLHVAQIAPSQRDLGPSVGISSSLGSLSTLNLRHIISSSHPLKLGDRALPPTNLHFLF